MKKNNQKYKIQCYFSQGEEDFKIMIEKENNDLGIYEGNKNIFNISHELLKKMHMLQSA